MHKCILPFQHQSETVNLCMNIMIIIKLCQNDASAIILLATPQTWGAFSNDANFHKNNNQNGQGCTVAEGYSRLQLNTWVG